MREALDQWPFVIAVYVVGFVALGLLIGWSYQQMRKAEKRREEMRRK